MAARKSMTLDGLRTLAALASRVAALSYASWRLRQNFASAAGGGRSVWGF
jgi:hypothetical protein